MSKLIDFRGLHSPSAFRRYGAAGSGAFLLAAGCIGLLQACSGGGSGNAGSGTGSGSSGSSGSIMSGSSGTSGAISGSSGTAVTGSSGTAMTGSSGTGSGSSGTGSGSMMEGGSGSMMEGGSSGTMMEGGSSGTMMDGGGEAEAGPMCMVASADAGSPAYLLVSSPLPFVVDTKFFPSGWQGDVPDIHIGQGLSKNDAGMTSSTCDGDRAPATTMGNCYKWTYDNVAQGTATNDAGGKAQGYASVQYQSLAPPAYNANFGSVSGIIIPPGATTLSFWAKGAAGGEVVGFGMGQIKNAVCNDSLIIMPVYETLTTAWTHYTVPLPAGVSYASGQIIGFNWTAVAASNGNAPLSDAGSDAATAGPITFFIDDIEWVGPPSEAGSTNDAGSSEASTNEAGPDAPVDTGASDAPMDTGSSDATGQ